MSTSIDNLAYEIAKELERYADVIEEEMEVAKKEVAKELVSELKRTSPRDTGSYATGWRVKKVGNIQVVHNATDYQLTHLLENGHAKSSGGRVPAKVHIRPAEEKAIEEYESRINKAVRG